MYYNECPKCGAHLDPGEKCDCEKEKGQSDANQHCPKEDDTSSLRSIPQKKKKVKPNPLRELRISKEIPAKDMVRVVRKLYPKYDKMLQSKCERGDVYGVDLRTDAMDELLERYAPELLEKVKYIRGGCHKLKYRVACRLKDDEYKTLMALIEHDGFETVQAWLAFVIRSKIKEYLKKENI